jgi:RimJ/RimL family protein N-acetyltransferase
VDDWLIEPATEETFEEIVAWRYPPPYDFYDGDVDPVTNPERFFEARDTDGRIVGFYYFEQRGDEVEYGLGLRPDLTGRGRGLRFVLAGLAFANEHYQPGRVVLHVAEFNQRALRVYERAGFRVVSQHTRSFDRFGEVPFLTMEASRATPPRPRVERR